MAQGICHSQVFSVISNNHWWLIHHNGKGCVTNVVFLYWNKDLFDVGKIVGIAFLNFCKLFNAISPAFVLKQCCELSAYVMKVVK